LMNISESLGLIWYNSASHVKKITSHGRYKLLSFLSFFSLFLFLLFTRCFLWLCLRLPPLHTSACAPAAAHILAVWWPCASPSRPGSLVLALRLHLTPWPPHIWPVPWVLDCLDDSEPSLPTTPWPMPRWICSAGPAPHAPGVSLAWRGISGRTHALLEKQDEATFSLAPWFSSSSRERKMRMKQIKWSGCLWCCVCTSTVVLSLGGALFFHWRFEKSRR
jgi:hypothetical protein